MLALGTQHFVPLKRECPISEVVLYEMCIDCHLLEGCPLLYRRRLHCSSITWGGGSFFFNFSPSSYNCHIMYTSTIIANNYRLSYILYSVTEYLIETPFQFQLAVHSMQGSRGSFIILTSNDT